MGVCGSFCHWYGSFLCHFFKISALLNILSSSFQLLDSPPPPYLFLSRQSPSQALKRSVPRYHNSSFLSRQSLKRSVPRYHSFSFLSRQSRTQKKCSSFLISFEAISIPNTQKKCSSLPQLLISFKTISEVFLVTTTSHFF